MAIYFGRIADERGHRFVLTLCCMGYLLALLWVLMTCRSATVFATQAQYLQAIFTKPFQLVSLGSRLYFCSSVVAHLYLLP